ncbi:PepSY-like domain-containing protein [Spirosoma sp. RP8]|uniref:PepSY-like domain-containing protein n=1 Tax=Spirosoma liriopis TaxID=2937440 RepID=A0ABT0HFR4_9BACT|nr:PepSY-like domain-containing protein [Spirosoma liriopis]MCK8490996.1 PepSY-like domain-containing protein [Spirosoma liriopis]
MKTLLAFSCVAAIVLSLNACNRNSVDPSTTTASARSGSGPSSTTAGPRSLTTVDVSSLPATITTYISANYAGATVKEAKKNAEGSYLVMITVNSTVKLLAFKADGSFDKEFDGKGGHARGDSAHRPKHAPGDSTHHPKPAPGDSVRHNRPGQGPAVTVINASSLPAAITTYITTNYAGATIEKAAQDKKSNDYVVLVKTADSKRVMLLFGSDGAFKKAVTGK